MMRTLYKYLVRMHPPAFRRQFAAEMLCIFDEAAESSGVQWLCFDCLVSLVRQWVLRSGSWKPAVAVMAALLQIVAGGFIWLTPWPPRSGAEVQVHTELAMGSLMSLILWLVGGMVLLVIAASLWVKRFIARRIDRIPAATGLAVKT
jgi:hypothetical protein